MDQTEVKISPKIQLRRDSKILSIGSCFADSIGEFLQADGYDVITNPGGILFNPSSINRLFQSVSDDTCREVHYGEFQGQHFHFDYHSKVNSESKSGVEANIEETHATIKNGLKEANFLILTFGTVWVWRLLETDAVIANCHKVPQDRFQKEMLGLDKMTELWYERIQQLKLLNPDLEIILTVSPVRHTRNGMHADKLSKSTLLLLCDALEKKFKSVHYFPAYEIVIDELRDYSSYKNDLIHPTDEAVEYVYEKFRGFTGE